MRHILQLIFDKTLRMERRIGKGDKTLVGFVLKFRKRNFSKEFVEQKELLCEILIHL